MTEYIVIEDDNVKLHFFQVLVNGWKSKCPTRCFGIMATKINCLISSDFFENIWRTRRLQLLSVILMIFQGRFWHEGMLSQWSGYAETGHSGHAPSLSASSQNWSWGCGLITEHRIKNNPSKVPIMTEENVPDVQGLPELEKFNFRLSC